MPRQPPSDVRAVLSKVPALRDYETQSTSHVATLWSNYGSIDRVSLRRRTDNAVARKNEGEREEDITSIIVKAVTPPAISVGANRDEGSIRKLLSYEVEEWFYQNLSTRLSDQAKVAKSYPLEREGEGNEAQPVRLVMEDLSVEYPIPARDSLNLQETTVVLRWLAHFHATFWPVDESVRVPGNVPPPLTYQGHKVEGVWEQGTYWYLDTRREALESMDKEEYGWLLKWTDKVNTALKKEAVKYGTLLHGDAKGANTVFSGSSTSSSDSFDQHQPLRCALYDFQYTGIGIVTRDLVCFLSKSAQSEIVRRREQEIDLLRVYHFTLIEAIGKRSTEAAAMNSYPYNPADSTDSNSLIDPQSTVIPSNHLTHGEIYNFETFWLHWELAVVDWYRFMAGWGFVGNHSWIDQRTREIVAGWERDGEIKGTDSTDSTDSTEMS